MNRLGNTIKGNCTNAKSCRADILCKVNTSFATTTLLLQGLTALSKLANPTSGAKTTEDQKRNISKHTRPRNKSFGHMTHFSLTFYFSFNILVNKGDEQRHSSAFNCSTVWLCGRRCKNAILGSSQWKTSGRLQLPLHAHSHQSRHIGLHLTEKVIFFFWEGAKYFVRTYYFKFFLSMGKVSESTVLFNETVKLF